MHPNPRRELKLTALPDLNTRPEQTFLIVDVLFSGSKASLEDSRCSQIQGTYIPCGFRVCKNPNMHQQSTPREDMSRYYRFGTFA